MLQSIKEFLKRLKKLVLIWVSLVVFIAVITHTVNQESSYAKFPCSVEYVVYRAQAVSFVNTVSLVKSSLLTWMLEVGEVTLGLGIPLLKFKLQADCQESKSSSHCAYVHMILLSVNSTFGSLLPK